MRVLVAIVPVLTAACDSSGPSEPGGALAEVRIEPENPRIEIESTLQLEATAMDGAGNAIDPGSIFWASENSEVATVSESGVVTARALGSTRIAASSQGVDAVTTVTVVPVPVATVAVSPSEVDIEVGGAATLSVTALDRNGDEVSDAPVTWSSENGDIASVDATGRVTARAAGTTKITAVVQGKSGSATIRVVAPVVDRIEISPKSAQLTVLGTQQFSAKAYSKEDVEITGRPVTWRTSNAAVVSISASGMALGLLPGSARVWAEIDGKRSPDVSVSVSARPVASVTIEPTSATLSVGETRQFQAVARASNGDQLDGRTIEWTTTSDDIATVSQDGTVSAQSPGTTKVRATSEGRQVEATITVTPAEVDRVEISPGSAQLKVGQTLGFEATARDRQGRELPGRTVTWSTSNASVITITTDGVATAVAQGSAKVRADIEGKRAEASVEVSSREVASVTISPASADLMVGATLQFDVVARDDEGQVLEGRPEKWSTSDPAVATVTPTGLAHGVAPGTTEIRVEVEGRRAEAELRVAPPPAASVQVQPSSAGLTVGESRKFSATAYDAEGAVIEGKQFVWSTSNDAVVSISQDGEAKAEAVGVAEIRATTDGQTGRATVTVEPVPVATVEVSPASVEIGLLETVQVTAVLKAADGTVLTGRPISWSSDKPAIATVSSTDSNVASVLGLLPGEATITATSEGHSGTAEIVVRLLPPPSGAKLEIVSGDNQTGPNDNPLPDPLVVRLVDASGRPIAGIEVKWSTNNGSVSPVTSVTDADGRAQTTWTLGGGNRRRERSAWAEVEGVGSVQFQARRD